jgi:(2R)-sulfolactate sulfo-lyase subunit beta
VILPVDDVSNAVARAVAARIPGTVPLCHSYGEMQYGEDEELTLRTLTGTGASPNVAAAVVIASEESVVARVAEGIARAGKAVEAFATWDVGDVPTAAGATRAAARMMRDASALLREPVERREVTMSMKCGESDATSALASCPATAWASDTHVGDGGTMLFGETSELTGGAGLLAERCVDAAVRERFLSTYERYVGQIKASGVDVFGSQPTLANVRGGLSTIEEKAIGNISKTGRSPVVDVLGSAEQPTRPGLNFMDTSSAAGECVTLMAAGGAVLHLFPCGGGNVVGHPVEPVLKLSANPATIARMSDHVDLDVSGLLRDEYGLGEAGQRLLAAIDATINGRLTCAEALGHRELIVTKLYPST